MIDKAIRVLFIKRARFRFVRKLPAAWFIQVNVIRTQGAADVRQAVEKGC